MRPFRLLVSFAFGYLVGTVPSADLAARAATRSRVDLRHVGSRNPGGINALRALGGAGRFVIVADVAKGFAGCAAGRMIAGDAGAHAAGVGAVAGHCYPVWNGFRGGKGLATSFGQCLYTFPAWAPFDLAVAVGTARIPGLRRPGLASTAAASAAWLLASVVWWRRRLPNSWGPEPTVALPLANAATTLMVAARTASELRKGLPDELEVAP
ncbi:MAG TPA: glycerol-3-phosphate acyltransferase [Gaiellaceae bacterium]|nr:glycerol-3-phosphate acyltransferase [Gaiellaceae bacterium]